MSLPLKVLMIYTGLMAASISSAILADDASKVAKNKMKMEEPMSTKMMKPGMKTGDVKKNAEKRARSMAPALEREEESMEQVKPK